MQTLVTDTVVPSPAPGVEAVPAYGPPWVPNFPSAALVETAAALFVTDPGRPARRESITATRAGWGFREGPQWRVIVSPGSFAVRSSDVARSERTYERQVEAARKDAALVLLRDLLAGPVCVDCGHESCRELRPRGRSAHTVRVVEWSAKSRAKMTQRLLELDYAPMVAGGGVPAMVTLTYPGGHLDGCQDTACRGCGWLRTATGPGVCRGHVEALKKRFRRRFGVPMVGVWKREFQERGAPHYHLMMVPPSGKGFREWLGREWADVVGDPDLVERGKHERAGTGVDYAEGMRSFDPKRLGVYFAKHGGYAAKEYQNRAPAEWPADEGVGRFWGAWGLQAETRAVEVTPAEAHALRRTARRWSRANAYWVRGTVWRSHAVKPGGGEGSGGSVDHVTGEILDRVWYQRKSARRVYRMRGQAGFLAVNDGPGFASALSRYADQVRAAPGRGGPVGWLP